MEQMVIEAGGSDYTQAQTHRDSVSRILLTYCFAFVSLLPCGGLCVKGYTLHASGQPHRPGQSDEASL